MSEYKSKTGKIGDTMVDAYKTVDDTVVGNYKKVEDAFVDAFLEKTDGHAGNEQEFSERK